jgi:hypothetical protein
VEPSGRHDLEGLDPTVIGAFSNRRAEIRAAVGAHGSRSTHGARVAALSTRDPKVARSSPSVVRSEWHRRARLVGFAPENLSRVTSLSHRDPDVVDEWRFASALAGHADRGVARRDVVRAWSASLLSGAPVTEIDACVSAWWPAPVAVGVAEVHRGPGTVVPPGHTVAVLGPRPSSSDGQRIWKEGASAVAAYRTRWGVHDRGAALGPDTAAARAAMPPLRLAHHLAVERTIADTCRALGRGEVRQRDRHRNGRALG